MKIFIVLFWPFCLSASAYLVFEVALGASYCSTVLSWLASVNFSGTGYVPDTLAGCMVTGSLLFTIILFPIYLVFTAIAMDLSRASVELSGLTPKSLLFVNFFMTFLYFMVFFGEPPQPSRGRAIFDFIMGYSAAFYLALVLYPLLVGSFWSLLFKLIIRRR